MHSFLFKKIEQKYTKRTLVENYQNILILISPIIPHFASECLEILGVNNKNFEWPAFEEKFIHNEKINLVIQINGKKRGLIKANRDMSESDLIKLIEENNEMGI